MFHKAKTEKERQAIFDEYMLNLLKRKQNIKRNQQIIDNSTLNFDPLNQDAQNKGVFNNYVDLLVVKGFLTEQIYTRLKINKNTALNFVNKLNSNEVMIMNRSLNDFIEYIKENYNNVNDYILKSSFNELKKGFNEKQLREKNNQVIKQNQEDKGEVISGNIPKEELEELEKEDQEEEAEAEKETEKEDLEDVGADEEQVEKDKFIDFLRKTVLKIKGNTEFRAPKIKKILLGELIHKDPDYYNNIKENEINNIYPSILLPLIQDEDSRLYIQELISKTFLRSQNIPEQFKQMNNNLFDIKIFGSGIHQDKYIQLGKYKAHQQKLIGGKLQVRSNNNNQVNNLKSQMITKNIRDILLKINKNETIKYSDVDKLDEDEKDQLYELGKKLHITELFDIPSTLKSQEDKLKDEFIKLRGSIMAGNDSPELIKKFKMTLIKLKNKKMISNQEYNEILNIFLEMNY